MTEPVFLLDTNICIYLLKDAAGPAASRLADCVPGSVAASTVTLAELLRGPSAHEAAALAAIRAMFETIGLLPFDEEAARAYARLPFGRGTFDRLIAAQALARDLILVTNNEGDFAGVAGLRIDNWARP